MTVWLVRIPASPILLPLDGTFVMPYVIHCDPFFIRAFKNKPFEMMVEHKRIQKRLLLLLLPAAPSIVEATWHTTRIPRRGIQRLSSYAWPVGRLYRRPFSAKKLNKTAHKRILLKGVDPLPRCAFWGIDYPHLVRDNHPKVQGIARSCGKPKFWDPHNKKNHEKSKSLQAGLRSFLTSLSFTLRRKRCNCCVGYSLRTPFAALMDTTRTALLPWPH